MTEQELKLATDSGLVENISPDTSNQESDTASLETPPEGWRLEDFIPILSLLIRPKSNQSTVPTGTPQSFADQVRFYNNNLYYYVNGAWRAAGSQVAFGTGTKSGGSGSGTEEFNIGFTPKIVILFAIGVGNNYGWSVGMATSTSDEKCIYRLYSSGGSVWTGGSTTTVICHVEDPGDFGNARECEMSSFDSDGFTLNWTAYTKNIVYAYLAIA